MTKKPLPALTTDEEARQFVETADLSEYDLSAFKPVEFVERCRKLMRRSAKAKSRAKSPLRQGSA